MIIYNYDEITHEYLGQSYADLDPQETADQGKDVYLIPANATTVKPPAQKKDKARVWQDTEWQYVADYRADYYKVSSSLSVEDITELGNIPEGYILVSKELGNLIKENPDDYIIDDNEVREKTAAEKEAEEEDRISHLKCTKRVFILMLEQLGFDYFEQIEPLINSNRQAKLEWELCVELERSNPLLDAIGQEMGVTHEQLNRLFQYANGEITLEEFRND